ncbi:MFS transporter [Streptomyces kronopolitis]|uniref:MFS transporter n=1 Tax=Streptomyces kronopolitis TaxID=1612435 RepID=UPI0020C11D12|nr:MFS transporter [Streptomyces kronopolitis]MCL6296874.1 MFS transporter [Streptomyces kronopolitis]
MDEKGLNRGRVLLAVALAQFTVTMVMSIVNVALPAIRSGLGFGPDQLSWVINAYSLVFGGLLLLGGRAADLYGHRRLLVLGALVFAAASLGGALAQSPAEMIVARVVQGLGAAAMAPSALAVLTTTQRAGKERTRALGVYAAVSAVGGAVGVLAGGLLTEYGGWRWVMFVNVPLALAVVWLAMQHIPAGAAAGARRLDVLGGVLGTGGIGLLVLGIVRTNQNAWTSATTLGTLAGAAVLLCAFAVVETRSSTTDPLVRFSLLARRGIGGANIFLLLVCAGQFAGFYFVSLYLQQVLALSPVATGAAFLPFCAGMIAGSAISTRLLGTLGAKALLVPGSLVAAVGFGWFSLISPSGSFLADILGPSLVAGFGIGVCFVPPTSTATEGLPPHEAGMASALLNSARQIGGALGLAVLVTVQVQHTDSALQAGRSPEEAMTSGFGQGLGLAGAILVAAALVAAVVLPSRPRTGAPDRPADAVGAPATEVLQ